MTKQEEERIFNGPFPWKKPGFVVVATGVVVWHAPPKDEDSIVGSTTLGKRARQVQEAYFRSLHEMKEEMEDLSRRDQQAEMQMTREDLARQWVELHKLGKEVQVSYVEFREWIAERLRAGGREEKIRLPGGSRRYNPREVPFWEPRWNRLLRASHLGLGGLRSLKRSVNQFNHLSGRYAALRDSRRSDVLQGSQSSLENPLEGYDPAEKPARILEAVVDLSQTQGGLGDVVDLKPVWMVLYRRIEGGSLEGEEAAKNVSEPLRNDLKRKGFGDQWPESPEELVDLAEDVLSQR